MSTMNARFEPWPVFYVLAYVLAFGFPVLSLLPPVAGWFEGSMRIHMLGQLPLLIGCGVVIGCLPWVQSCLRYLDPKGFVCAILVSGWLVFWMLPINLDAAQGSLSFRLLKVVSLPIFVGLTGFWAWQCLGGVGRGVLVLEAWAMLMRVGWIFLISPEQVCANYLPYEQQQVGKILLYFGFLSAACMVIYVFFRPEEAEKP